MGIGKIFFFFVDKTFDKMKKAILFPFPFLSPQAILIIILLLLLPHRTKPPLSLSSPPPGASQSPNKEKKGANKRTRHFKHGLYRLQPPKKKKKHEKKKKKTGGDMEMKLQLENFTEFQ